MASGLWSVVTRQSWRSSFGWRGFVAPNQRLQRTRAALLPQSRRGEKTLLGDIRRAPLNRKPLGDGGKRRGPGR